MFDFFWNMLSWSGLEHGLLAMIPILTGIIATIVLIRSYTVAVRQVNDLTRAVKTAALNAMNGVSPVTDDPGIHKLADKAAVEALIDRLLGSAPVPIAATEADMATFLAKLKVELTDALDGVQLTATDGEQTKARIRAAINALNVNRAAPAQVGDMTFFWVIKLQLGTVRKVAGTIAIASAIAIAPFGIFLGARYGGGTTKEASQMLLVAASDYLDLHAKASVAEQEARDLAEAALALAAQAEAAKEPSEKARLTEAAARTAQASAKATAQAKAYAALAGQHAKEVGLAVRKASSVLGNENIDEAYRKWEASFKAEVEKGKMPRATK